MPYNPPRPPMHPVPSTPSARPAQPPHQPQHHHFQPRELYDSAPFDSRFPPSFNHRHPPHDQHQQRFQPHDQQPRFPSPQQQHYRRRSRSPPMSNSPGGFRRGERGAPHWQSSPSNDRYERDEPRDRMDRRDDRFNHRHNNDFDHSRRFDDRSDRRSQEPSPPNINVVLRGLPDNAQERDIQRKLESMEASIDEVTLIRSRETGESRQFAFVRFTSVGHAVQFFERYFPYFFMGEYRVRIDYCHKNGVKDNKLEWRCQKCKKFNEDYRRVCVECRAPYESSTAQTRSNETESIEINDGSKDVSFTPSSMILIRNLDNLTTEETLFQALKEFEGLHRVLLIRDKLAKMSCEYGFAEFKSAQLAAKAIESMGDEFNVDRRTVKISYANPDSFLPVYVASEWAVRADVPDGLWAYGDRHSYACEYSEALVQERLKKEKEQQELEAKRLREEEEERTKKLEEAMKPKEKESLEDDLDAFYADMGDFLSDEKDGSTDIFSVPKAK